MGQEEWFEARWWRSQVISKSLDWPHSHQKTQEKDEEIWVWWGQDMSQWKQGRVHWWEIIWEPSYQSAREHREAWNKSWLWVGSGGEIWEILQRQNQLDFSHWARGETCHLFNLHFLAWLTVCTILLTEQEKEQSWNRFGEFGLKKRTEWGGGVVKNQATQLCDYTKQHSLNYTL